MSDLMVTGTCIRCQAVEVEQSADHPSTFLCKDCQEQSLIGYRDYLEYVLSDDAFELEATEDFWSFVETEGNDPVYPRF